METAKLELINPYSKYGLKRRPTYAEIAGLIYENQELLRGQRRYILQEHAAGVFL